MQVEFTSELLTADGPPTEFRLLKLGKNATTKGEINLTRAAMSAVIASIKEDGRDQNRLSFDFNHAQLRAVTAEEGKSAGWFSVEAREDGLWIVNAEWTPAASAALSAREYRFFSPVLMLNKDREPTRLINVALTNLPATKNQTPLVASQTEAPASQPKESPVDESVLKLFGALSVSDAAGAEAKFVSLSQEVVALQGAAKELTEELSQVKSELADRDAKELVAQRDRLIVELSEAGKLVPAMHAWAKTQSIESLSEYGKAAPVTAPAGKKVEAPKSEERAELSEAQQISRRLLGLTNEDLS